MQVVELNSTVARMQTENTQMERAMAESKRMKDKLGQVERKAADYHRHSNLMQQEAQNISQELRAATEKERLVYRVVSLRPIHGKVVHCYCIGPVEC